MKKSKVLISLFIMSLLVVGLGVNIVAAEETHDLKLSTNLNQNHIVAKGYYEMAEAISEDSNGNVKITIYPSEQLGVESDVVSAISMGAGTADMVVPGPGELSKYLEKINIFDAPYVFNNPDHMTSFANSEKAQPLWNELAKKSNLRVLGVIYYGTRHMTNNGFEGKIPEDFNGLKLRVPDQQMALSYGKVLGASPVAMSFGEVYMGLQQGVIDGQENPLPTIWDNALYEVQENLVMTGHVIAAVAITIDENKWQSMSQETQNIIKENVQKYAVKTSNSVKRQESKILEDLKGEGMNIVEPNKDAFREATTPLYNEYENTWGEWLETIQNF